MSLILSQWLFTRLFTSQARHLNPGLAFFYSYRPWYIMTRFFFVEFDRGRRFPTPAFENCDKSYPLKIILPKFGQTRWFEYKASFLKEQTLDHFGRLIKTFTCVMIFYFSHYLDYLIMSVVHMNNIPSSKELTSDHTLRFVVILIWWYNKYRGTRVTADLFTFCLRNCQRKAKFWCSGSDIMVGPNFWIAEYKLYRTLCFQWNFKKLKKND